MQEVPSLHRSMQLPATARAITSLGVRLLNCSYCGFYYVRVLTRGFAEHERMPTHHYAAVQGAHACCSFATAVWASRLCRPLIPTAAAL
jgi:hypothetical protein